MNDVERGWYYDLTDTDLPGDARWQIEVCYAESEEDADDQIGDSARGPRGPYDSEEKGRQAADDERYQHELSEACASEAREPRRR